MDKKVYILLGFDMETDIGSYTSTYQGVQEGTEKILQILNRYNLGATFLFTGDAAENNKDVVKHLHKCGHEIGCHSLQHETVGDALFNIPSNPRITKDEVRPRLKKNIEILQSITETRPVSFRAPRLWQGNEQIIALEESGFLVDASYSVNKYKERILPYHPSRDNWLKEGNLNLLEIPNFCFIKEGQALKDSYTGLDQWPKLRTKSADFVLVGIKKVIEVQYSQSDIAVLAFYLHPWEAIEIPEKYEYDEGVFYFHKDIYLNTGKYFVEQLRLFVDSCVRSNYIFTTFKEIYDLSYF